MPERVKIHLKVDSREIELEGTREDVDDLLTKWWSPSPSDSTDRGDDPLVVPTGKSRVSTRRRRSTNTGPAQNGGNKTFDSQPIVNAMREDERHDVWETKVLHAKSAINKIKLVCWFNKQYRTTGEIKAVLEGLGVKMSLSNLSNTLKDSLSDFLQDSARSSGAKPRYKLTSKAEADFEAWLNKNE